MNVYFCVSVCVCVGGGEWVGECVTFVLLNVLSDF